MNPKLPPAPSNESVRLNYFQWKDLYKKEKPYEVISELPQGSNLKPQNFSLAPGPKEETIHDLRGRVSAFNLDDHGFQILAHTLPVDMAFDEDTVRRRYFPMVERILQSVDPGAEILIFDWRVCTVSYVLIDVSP